MLLFAIAGSWLPSIAITRILQSFLSPVKKTPSVMFCMLIHVHILPISEHTGTVHTFVGCEDTFDVVHNFKL